MKRFYFDHAATTPLRPGVAKAMQEAAETFGNPSSQHADGRAARGRVDEAREVIAHRLGGAFAEIVFTGSGSEGAALALVGLALANQDSSRTRFILGAAEHHCVLGTKPFLERLGYQVDLCPVDRFAKLDLNALEALIGYDVLAVSLMHANNEFGTMQPVKEASDLAHRHGALLHCDAVQTLGLPGWKVDDVGADLVQAAAHKVGGPKGVGALWVRGGVKLKPIIGGGSQEREQRAGTENIAGVVGFASAVSQISPRAVENLAVCKAAFLKELERVPVSYSSPGEATQVHPGIVHFTYSGLDAETVLIRLDREGVSAGSGAACSSGSLEPSHVMIAAGYSASEARQGLRFSFGPPLTPAEVTAGAQVVAKVLAELSQGRAKTAISG